jgi:ABC-2 type transport system permease protein
MMRSVFKWTLWQRRWSMFWWSLGIVGLVVLTLAFYPTIHDQAAQLNKSFGGLSNDTLALFGGTDFFSPVGYLNSQLVYLMLPLLLIILGVGLGSSLIGREEADGTIHVLLARGISRPRLLFAKALAGAFILFLVTCIGSVAVIGMAQAVHIGIPLLNLIAVCFTCYLLVLTFSAAAFLLAATGRGRAAAMGITVVYTLGGYIIGSLASTVHWLHGPSVIFPYHYYYSADILSGTFRWSSIAFFAVFTAACTVLSWVSFRRRDLD